MSQSNVMFEELKKYGIIAGMVISAVTFLDSRNEKLYDKLEEYHLAVIAIDKKTDIIEKDVEYLKSGLFSESLEKIGNALPLQEGKPLKKATSFIFPHPLFFDENLNIKIIASL